MHAAHSNLFKISSHRNFKLILPTILFFLSFSSAWGQVVTIDFEDGNSWVAGSLALTSYSNPTYSSNSWSFSSSNALRNTASIQDGITGAFGAYSWRLKDAATFLEGSFNGSGSIIMIQFYVRRWDASPNPSFELLYTFDGGQSWMNSGLVINNSFLENSSQWKVLQYFIPNPQSVPSGSFRFKIQRVTGERIMIDNFAFIEKFEWTGSISSDPALADNWSPAVLPSSTASIVIPTGLTNYPSFANNNTNSFGSITIDAGASLILQSGAKLTVTGTLTNNGTLILQDGATFVQGTSVSGGGTYNIQQNLDNCTNDGTNPTGRFWYLGSPVTSLRENSFGNTGNLNKVWSFTNGAYTAIADGATLSPTTGYVHRRGSNALPLTFTGTNLYAEDVTLSLSNNAGTYGGWHLIANPYTAYLDWHQVAGSNLSSNLSNTYYIRSYNASGAGDVNALISYNSSTGLESNTSSLSLTSAQAQYIAPMQAIWVKINPTTPLSATAGQLRLERAFTSHQTGNVGLKSSTIFPTLARVNLVNGARFDQILVYMNPDMTNGVDQYDSEKMFVTGAPQLYTIAAGKKLVMNGLKNNKSKISVPLYLELPESKVYQLSLAEYILEDGLILLEDKQEGTIQDFTIHDVYAFYATSGVLQNRFVLHFFKPENGITAQGPSNSWVEEEAAINESGNILVNSNGRGKVTIQQDIDQSPTAKGSVVVRDAAGREVWKGQLSGSATTLELDTPSGIYFVEVELNGQVEMKKIFVQQ